MEKTQVCTTSRVEPSVLGGEALGKFLWDVIRRELECDGVGAHHDVIEAEGLFEK